MWPTIILVGFFIQQVNNKTVSNVKVLNHNFLTLRNQSLVLSLS
jgi:hypothetical protein